MDDKQNKLLKLSIDALWRCKSPFTQNDIIREMGKEDIEIKDFNKFKEIFKDILIEENGLFKIDITIPFNKMYNKEGE